MPLSWRYAAAGAAVLGLGLALALVSERWSGEREAPAGDVVSDAARETAQETAVEPRLAVTSLDLPARPPAVTPGPTIDPYPAAAPEVGVAALPPERSPPTVSPVPRAPAPAWQRYAAAAADAAGRPMIAIVIDDLGQSGARLRRTIRLKAPLTLAFLPYGADLPALTAEARRAGHEVLVHLPMEPIDPSQDPGPNGLVTGLDEAELLHRLRWNLSRFGGYVGVNNHMGSRFSSDEAGMAAVMGEVKARGLLYLDSRTTPHTLGSILAQSMGVPEVERDVFLDNDLAPEGVRRQLAVLEDEARRQGFAVAIGHPHPITLEALEGWLPGAEARGFVLVPVSAIVRRRMASASAGERLTLQQSDVQEWQSNAQELAPDGSRPATEGAQNAARAGPRSRSESRAP